MITPRSTERYVWYWQVPTSDPGPFYRVLSGEEILNAQGYPLLR